MSVPLAGTPGAVGDGEEEEGDGKKKAKNTYKQLIKGIPGACLALGRSFDFHIQGRKTLDEEG